MANETHESVIGSDVEIIGTIKSSGTVRLDGKLDFLWILHKIISRLLVDFRVKDIARPL